MHVCIIICFVVFILFYYAILYTFHKVVSIPIGKGKQFLSMTAPPSLIGFSIP